MTPDAGLHMLDPEESRLIHALSIVVAKLEERVGSSFDHMRESIDHLVTSLEKSDKRLTDGDADLRERIEKLEGVVQYAKGAMWAFGLVGMAFGAILAKVFSK